MLGEHGVLLLAHAKPEWNLGPCVCKVSMEFRALHILGEHLLLSYTLKIFFLFIDMILLNCPGTLQPYNPPASASQVAGTTGLNL